MYKNFLRLLKMEVIFPTSKYTSEIYFSVQDIEKSFLEKKLKFYSSNYSVYDKYKDQDVVFKLRNEKTYSSSTEHIVFFGQLIFSDLMKIDVVLKFVMLEKITEENEHEKQIKLFTQKHASYVSHNYNLAARHLNDFKSDKIKINDLFILSDKDGFYWIEKKVNEFITFYNKNQDLLYIDQIITTDEPELKALQNFIFENSGYQYTIIDLQGSKEDGVIILCDVEYSTKPLYGFDSHMLKERYIQHSGVKSITLKDIDNRIGNLEKEVAQTNNRLLKVEILIAEMNGKISLILDLLQKK